MRPSTQRLDSGFLQCLIYHRGDCVGVETDQRCPSPDKYATVGTSRSGILEIISHCSTHFYRQGHLFYALAFALNSNGAGFPIDVVEGQLDYLCSAQAEPRQQKQNAVVALTCCRFPITGVYDPLDLFGRKEFR